MNVKANVTILCLSSGQFSCEAICSFQSVFQWELRFQQARKVLFDINQSILIPKKDTIVRRIHKNILILVVIIVVVLPADDYYPASRCSQSWWSRCASCRRWGSSADTDICGEGARINSLKVPTSNMYVYTVRG